MATRHLKNDKRDTSRAKFMVPGTERERRWGKREKTSPKVSYRPTASLFAVTFLSLWQKGSFGVD